MSYRVGEIPLQSGIRPLGLFDFFPQASDVPNRSTDTGKSSYHIGQSVDLKGKGVDWGVPCVYVYVCMCVGM